MMIFAIVLGIFSVVGLIGAILEVNFTVTHFTYTSTYTFAHWNLWRTTRSDFYFSKADNERLQKTYENGGIYVEKLF